MDATLRQAGKILELIGRSGRSSEWVQDHLIGSGAFSDLLEADNLQNMDRDARRHSLGLGPLNPQLLEFINTVTIPARAERFVASEQFVLNYGSKAEPGVLIAYLGDNLKSWFSGKTEGPTAETKLRYSKVVKSSANGPILAELGDRAGTTLAQIWALMELQPNGEDGILLTNGWGNIFYMDDRAVHVFWYGGGWLVRAAPVTGPSWWLDGRRVFSRDS